MELLLLVLLIAAIAAAVLVLNDEKYRMKWLTRPLYNTFKKVLPAMSDTERDALEAGTVWWEGELFSGKPNWRTLHSYPKPSLSPAEQSFLDNEVNVVCNMVDDWALTRDDSDLTPEVWHYLKTKGFFSMIIPTEYGGLGFSAQAHSAVVSKLSTRSSALSVTVMVPNSLGPAELLIQYGTEEQKNHYLPRLARGDDIPAFALTSPWAGSDDAAIPDSGTVCMGEWQGEQVLGMRVSWDKRYITLAPVCTVLGLAFRLYDPDGLLGDTVDIGITCALVPSDHLGVQVGHRHFPLDAMFMNGPTRGNNVFIPLDFIIGGAEQAGKGWRMLMECLAAGRSISLPSSYAGMARITALSVGAYSTVRQQFNTPIARFEGVAEALARIGGYTYLMDAARSMTAQSVDLGEKPAVSSAIVKYHLTELGRQVVNDGMDIIGGKGICLGPSNFLGRAYQQLPVGITVEGANILTRSLIIFGQGAIRCHPYVLAEMQAVQNPDTKAGLHEFDRAFWAHMRFSLRNSGRTLLYGLSGRLFSKVDVDVAPAMRPYYHALNRFSAAFAMLADTSMLVLGGSLKRRESLSGRLGDVLSQLYLISAVLKRYEDEGRQAADAPFAHWAIQDALHRLQQAFDEILRNFPNRPIAVLVRLCIFPYGRTFSAPTDKLGQEVARLITQKSDSRHRLTQLSFIPKGSHEPIRAIESAFDATLATRDIDAKIRAFEKSGQLDNNPQANVRDIATAVYLAKGISQDEYEKISARNVLRDQVIAVDEFTLDFTSVQSADTPADIVN